MDRSTTLSDLITQTELTDLREVVRIRKPGQSVHNVVMKWLDNNPEVTKRFVRHGVIKAYGAYVFEYYLNLK